MTCRLLIVSETAERVLDYWTATRGDCLEMAWLWRWSGAWVWLEYGRF